MEGIGYYINGVFTPHDEEELLNEWNNMLSESDIDAELNKVIFIDADTAYYLRATGVEYTSTQLVNVDEISKLIGLLGITCTTKTCSNSSTGCVPKKDRLGCTDCWSGDCTKSITAN